MDNSLLSHARTIWCKLINICKTYKITEITQLFVWLNEGEVLPLHDTLNWSLLQSIYLHIHRKVLTATKVQIM